jgi:hypothetical protein
MCENAGWRRYAAVGQTWDGGESHYFVGLDPLFFSLLFNCF